MPDPVEETSLIARILRGERELFHDLIQPYQRLAYLTALSILKNEGDAEDIAQEAILKAYRALASFRSEARFSTWLVTIVRNEARTRLRKIGRAPTESLDTPADGHDDFTPHLLADWREIPSEALERQELASQIEQAIVSLPNTYREVFMLRDKDALSIQEIADLLGVHPNLVKVRLFRARILLQKQLAPYLKLQGARPRWRLPLWSTNSRLGGNAR